MKQEEIRKLLFNDILAPLADLKGDRRNQLEIQQRILEGLRRLGNPVGRILDEFVEPLVIRDIMLITRNGGWPQELPPEMQGKNFKIEFIGRLAMELKNQQSQGFLRWAGYAVDLEGTFAGVTDNVDYDGGFRRLGESLGVSIEDIATEEEVEAKREARQAQIQEQKMMEIAQMAGQAYPGATKAPEEGSPAGALMGQGA